MSKSEHRPVALWVCKGSFTASINPEARNGRTHKEDAQKSSSHNMGTDEPTPSSRKKSGSDKKEYDKRTSKQLEKHEMQSATCMRRAPVSSHQYQQTQTLRKLHRKTTASQRPQTRPS